VRSRLPVPDAYVPSSLRLDAYKCRTEDVQSHETGGNESRLPVVRHSIGRTIDRFALDKQLPLAAIRGSRCGRARSLGIGFRRQ